MTRPPTPFHLLRVHHAPLSVLHFNPTNTLLYSGDQDGFVAITDLKLRRVVVYWQAHEGGLLGLEDWQNGLISHGRDNTLHFYEPLARISPSTTGPNPSLPPPRVYKTLPTNSLNFCRFSLCPVLQALEPDLELKGKTKEREALIIVPSLMDSELVSVEGRHLAPPLFPTGSFVHQPCSEDDIFSSVVRPNRRVPTYYRFTGLTMLLDSGMIMSLHLQFLPRPDIHHPILHAIIGFEDGRVEVWTCGKWDGKAEEDVEAWNKVWTWKGHNEAATFSHGDGGGQQAGKDIYRVGRPPAGEIRAAFSTLTVFATCVRTDDQQDVDEEQRMSKYSIKQIGHASLSISADDAVIAVGGWDGRIRLYSTSSFKPLGILEYHRDTVHAVAFGHPAQVDTAETESVAETLEFGEEDESDEDEDDGMEGQCGSVPPRERWLASGGKDTRVALWGLMDFKGNDG
ncbi:ASTRA-associated protein 1, partial [Tremellales sp. Uapishka_1]